MAIKTAPTIAAVIVITATAALAQTPSTLTAQQTFALALASASIAQSDCGMNGETLRAQSWIDSNKSGFSAHNQSDLRVIVSMMVLIKQKKREMGDHAWCIEYKTKMAPLFQPPY